MKPLADLITVQLHSDAPGTYAGNLKSLEALHQNFLLPQSGGDGTL